MEYEVVGEYVLHFPSYFTYSDDLVNFFESTVSSSIPEWSPWLSGGDQIPTEYGLMKYVDRKEIESDSLKSEINFLIGKHDEAIYETFLIYLKYLGTSEKNIQLIKDQYLSHTPPSFTLKKYYKSMGIGAHPDWGKETPAVHTSATYLSDGYVGGELKFPDLNTEITLTKGSIVIFPSIFMHSANAIVSGTKYLINEITCIEREFFDGRCAYE